MKTTQHGTQHAFSTLDQIQSAVSSGTRVFVGNHTNEVVCDRLGQWFIRCALNGYLIGLTWRDGRTLNAKVEDFFAE